MSPTGTGNRSSAWRISSSVVTLFALDAQFDPSTARESIIENAWNEWLVTRCGDAIAQAALATLAENRPEAWQHIPLERTRRVVGADAVVKGFTPFRDQPRSG